MTSEINKALMQIVKRAESGDPQTLMSTFVDVGPLLTLLRTPDNQVVYGRRGTGKTHAFMYQAQQVENHGDWGVYLDLRQIGSSGGLYGDSDLPLSERSTRLLVDVLAALHDSLTNRVLEGCFSDPPTITEPSKALAALDG
jgi:hypothetical protein